MAEGGAVGGRIVKGQHEIVIVRGGGGGEKEEGQKEQEVCLQGNHRQPRPDKEVDNGKERM